MAHSGSAEHHSPGAASASGGQPWFPAAEWEALQAQDREAARNIVCLLVGVFVTGFIMYLFIAITL